MRLGLLQKASFRARRRLACAHCMTRLLGFERPTQQSHPRAYARTPTTHAGKQDSDAAGCAPSDASPLWCVSELDLPSEPPNALLGSSGVRMYAESCGCRPLPNVGMDCAPSSARQHTGQPCHAHDQPALASYVNAPVKSTAHAAQQGQDTDFQRMAKASERACLPQEGLIKCREIAQRDAGRGLKLRQQRLDALVLLGTHAGRAPAAHARVDGTCKDGAPIWYSG